MNAAATTPDRWTGYYKKTGSRPPRPTLLLALDKFDDEGAAMSRLAVDLGAGGGRDVIEMLRRGWRVIAIDAEPDAGAAIRRVTICHQVLNSKPVWDGSRTRTGRFATWSIQVSPCRSVPRSPFPGSGQKSCTA